MAQTGLGPDPPLYFLHIPRTAGTSVTAELENHYSALEIFPGHLLCQLAFFPPSALATYRLFRGHLGTVLPDRLGWWVRAVTVLRDPLSTVLSLFSFASNLAWHPLHRRVTEPGYGFSEFLRDPECRALTSNWQARWLVGEPPPGDLAWATIPAPGAVREWQKAYHLRPLGLDDDELLSRAGATLDRCEVVGVTERLTETLTVLASHMRWLWSGAVTRRNMSPSPIAADSVDTDDRRLAGDLNQVDAELHRRAAHRLGELAETAITRPSVPAPPLAELPYEYDWSMPLVGRGWHDRAFDPRVGWHRWTGPGNESVLELPVAGGARACIEIAVAGAADPAALSGLAVLVDGVPAALEASPDGVVTVLRGTIDLPPVGPLRLTFTVPRTASLRSVGPDFDPRRAGGVAVAKVRLCPVAPVVVGTAPSPGTAGARLGFNKACEIEDFDDPELKEVVREVFHYKQASFPPGFPQGVEHRKDWEVAMAVRSLREFGAVHPDASVLGVAAGVEDTVFHLTEHVARVFATDRYLAAGPWRPLAPLAMMVEPAEVAPPRSFEVARLVVQHMDGRWLRYPDASFDGIFSSGSIEHFGDVADVAAAAYEMGRVLRPGGVLALSTELCLVGPPGGRGWGGLTLVLPPDEIKRFIIEASGLEPVDELRTDVSARTLATSQNLTEALTDHLSRAAGHSHRPDPSTWTAWRFPYVVLEQSGYVFGSVHLTLRKTDRYPAVPNAWAKPSSALRESIADFNRSVLDAVEAAAAAASAPGAERPQ